MAELSQKRSRKTKLVLRDCAEFPVEKYTCLQEHTQPLEQTVVRHSGDVKQSSVRTFSIEVEVEECNEDEEMETIDNLQVSSHDIATMENYEILSYCCLDEATIKQRIEELSKTTTSLADKVIEMEIRHMWGKTLKTETPDRHDTLIQDALQSWKTWHYQSKFRDGIVSFKCYICKLAWWHLSPFQEHIKMHDKLIVETETTHHECHIVCYNTVSKRQDIKIEGDCWRCLKSSETHMIANRISEVHYKCEGCNTLFLTCFKLIEHEGICQKYHKIIFKDLVRHESDWKCDICGLHCLTRDRYDAHLLGRHSVRSDEVMAMAPMKKCAFCAGHYYVHNVHICPSKQFNFQCVYCYRKFQTTFSVNFHQDMVKQDFYCRVCNKYLKKQCMEFEHMFTHSKNYIFAYRCTVCDSFIAFPDERSLLMHLSKVRLHKNQLNPRKKNYEMVILPRSCMTGSSDSKQKSADIRKKKKIIEPNNKRSKIYNVLELNKDSTAEMYENKQNSEENTLEEAHHLQSELIIKNEILDDNIDIKEEIDVDNIKTEVEESLSNVFKPSKHIFKKENFDDTLSVMFQGSEDQNEDNSYEEMLSKVFQTSGNIPEGLYNDELSDDDYEDDIIVLNTNFIQDNNLTEFHTVDPIETRTSLKPNETITSSFLKPNETKASSSKFNLNKSKQTVSSEKLTSSFSTNKTKPSSSNVNSNPTSSSNLNPNKTKAKASNVHLNATRTSSSNLKPNKTKAKSSILNPNATINSSSNLNPNKTKAKASILNPNATITSSSNLKPNETITRKGDQPVKTKFLTNIEPKEPSYTQIKIKEEPEYEITFEDIDEPTIENIKTEPDILEEFLNSTVDERNEIKRFNEIRTYGRIVKLKRNEAHSSETDPDMEPEIAIISGRSKKTYRCKRCNFIGLHREYKDHLNNFCPKHNPRIDKKEPWPEFCCTKCDKTFPRMKSYVLHLKDHGLPFGHCPQCNVIFSEPNRIMSHLTTHIRTFYVKLHLIKDKSSSEKMYQCKVCGKKVKFVDFFKHWESHFELEKVKKEVKVDPEPVNEEFVGNTALPPESVQLLTDMLQLSPYETKAGDDIRYCALCSRAFARRNDSKRHLIEHLLVDAYANKPRYAGLKCQICAETCFKAERYREHMRNHGFLPVYKCEICNKTFSDSSNFAKHKKVHNLKCMICDICKKKFQSKVQLIKHIEQHKTIEPWKCKECDRLFYTASSFRKHHHNGKKSASFRCVICRQKFSCLKDKWQHSWERHGERSVKADCPVCEMPFRKLQDVKTHMRTHHQLAVNFSAIINDLRKQIQAKRSEVDKDYESAASSAEFTMDKNTFSF